MLIWRRVVGKSAVCGFKVGIFAVMADCLKIGVFAAKLLMGILFHKVRKKVNRVSKSFLYNFETGFLGGGGKKQMEER
jgi:hypothetical protein